MDRDELRETVTAAASGYRNAFERLYSEYHDRLYFFVLKNVGNKETAEDITHDTFLRSMERIGELKEPAAYVGWLHSIAYRKCLDEMSARSRMAQFSTDEEQTAAIENVQLNEPVMLPEDYASNEEVKRTVRDAMNALPQDIRSAVILYYYNDLPVKEVAAALGVSENSVRLKLFRARKTLRERLEKLSQSGMLCAVPLGSVVQSSIDVKPLPAGAGASVSSATVAAHTSGSVARLSIGKIAALCAAAAVAVGVPIGLAMNKDKDGGLIGDVQPESSYAESAEDEVLTNSGYDTESTVNQNGDPDTTTISAESVEYDTDTHRLLFVSDDVGLCEIEVPEADREDIEFFKPSLPSGARLEITYSGDIEQGYPSTLGGVSSVKFIDKGSDFVVEHLSGLLTKCADLTEEEIESAVKINEYVEEIDGLSMWQQRALVYLIQRDLDKTARAADNGDENVLFTRGKYSYEPFDGYAYIDSSWYDGEKIDVGDTVVSSRRSTGTSYYISTELIKQYYDPDVTFDENGVHFKLGHLSIDIEGEELNAYADIENSSGIDYLSVTGALHDGSEYSTDNVSWFIYDDKCYIDYPSIKKFLRASIQQYNFEYSIGLETKEPMEFVYYVSESGHDYVFEYTDGEVLDSPQGKPIAITPQGNYIYAPEDVGKLLNGDEAFYFELGGQYYRLTMTDDRARDVVMDNDGPPQQYMPG